MDLRTWNNNNIVEFNPLVFEIFSISSFDPTLELLSMNVSSNRLESLDDASVMWLKDTATVTDPSGNPWKCECTALGEAWRELRHKLTLNCVSPEDRRGRTWDVLEEDLCPDRIKSMEPTASDKPNASSDATPNINTDTDTALSTSLIIAAVVSVACFLVVVYVISLQLRNTLRRRSEVPGHKGSYVLVTERVSSVGLSSKVKRFLRNRPR